MSMNVYDVKFDSVKLLTEHNLSLDHIPRILAHECGASTLRCLGGERYQIKTESPIPEEYIKALEEKGIVFLW